MKNMEGEIYCPLSTVSILSNEIYLFMKDNNQENDETDLNTLNR